MNLDSEMQLIDINESQIKALSKIGMSLTHYWLLHLLYHADTVVYIPQIRERKLLEDRGLINKSGILQAGRLLYEQIRDTKLETPQTGKKKDTEVTENHFEEFWSAYPASANFSIKGMQFTSSRALRSNKQVCKMLYDSAIAQGEVTEEQIIAATKYMTEEAKKESFESGLNKLQFLPGVEVFLRQQRYLAFVEIADTKSEEGDSNYWA